MSLKFDMEYGVFGNVTNFSAQLLRLMQKADMSNRARLAIAFPNAYAVFTAEREGREIPDLPYDGQE